jgi:hypothetical protein
MKDPESVLVALFVLGVRGKLSVSVSPHHALPQCGICYQLISPLASGSLISGAILQHSAVGENPGILYATTLDPGWSSLWP